MSVSASRALCIFSARMALAARCFARRSAFLDRRASGDNFGFSKGLPSIPSGSDIKYQNSIR
jgi:hypothetical protein